MLIFIKARILFYNFNLFLHEIFLLFRLSNGFYHVRYVQSKLKIRVPLQNESRVFDRMHNLISRQRAVFAIH